MAKMLFLTPGIMLVDIHLCASEGPLRLGIDHH